jgi:hypothetical protein
MKYPVLTAFVASIATTDWKPRMATKALERVREMITKGWCQRTMARDKDGRQCVPFSPEMQQCCLDTAITYAAAEVANEVAETEDPTNYPLYYQTKKVVNDILIAVIRETDQFKNIIIDPYKPSVIHANDDPGTTQPIVLGWVVTALVISKELEKNYVHPDTNLIGKENK